MNRLIYNKEIYGYKAFNKGLINQYGDKYEVGHTYIFNNFTYKKGMYFCKNIEDCFIFYRDTNNIDVCYVKGYGILDPYENDYYGVYDVYSSSKLDIIYKLYRYDIINMFLNYDNYHYDRLLRFISLYKLTKDEIILFTNIYHNNKDVMKYIDYYQNNNKNAFTKKKSII